MSVLQADICVQIDAILSRYGDDPQYALAAMQDMQDELGYVPREGIEALSAHTAVPMGQLYALSTFYKALSLKPKGEHIIKICAGTSCHIRGGENIADGITRLIGISPGDTSEDGLFSFDEVHCVGACALAPVVIIDERLYGNVTLEQLPAIFAACGLEVAS